MTSPFISKFLVKPLQIDPQWDVYQHLKVEPLEQTEAQVKKFFETPLDETLQGRVKCSDGATQMIDHTFKVKLSTTAPYEKAYQTWKNIRNQSWWIMVIDGLIAMGGLAVARQTHDPIVWIAGLVMAVCGFYLLGNRLVHYIPANRQYQAWKNPGADFARRRTEALQLPFSDMLKHRYQASSQKGTITDLELFVIWKMDFKQSADEKSKANPKNNQELVLEKSPWKEE